MTVKRVLVVDDERDLIDVLSPKIRDLGCDVAGETDPVEARRMAMINRPDLIVMDLHIPGWNGLELMASLLHLPALMGVPIMIYTSLQDPGLEPRAVELGASGFFLKIKDDQRLLDKIKIFLDAKPACEER